METRESEDLFAAIASYLSTYSAQSSEPEPRRTYRDGRTQITAAEVGLFMDLMNGPLRREEIAGRLERNLESTQEFLDALVAIGILERAGDCYANTPATTLYCRALFRGLLSESGEDEWT